MGELPADWIWLLPSRFVLVAAAHIGQHVAQSHIVAEDVQRFAQDGIEGEGVGIVHGNGRGVQFFCLRLGRGEFL